MPHPCDSTVYDDRTFVDRYCLLNNIGDVNSCRMAIGNFYNSVETADESIDCGFSSITVTDESGA